MLFNWMYVSYTFSLTILLIFCGTSETTRQGCTFTLTQNSGTFQTPNFPGKYPNGVQCIWNIKVRAGRFILLSFDTFVLESFGGNCIDMVEVKDGSKSTDQLLGTFCNASLPPKVITSSSNNLRLWFFSDKRDAYKGFHASYTSQREKGCGGSVTDFSGRISSPRYPDYPYPNSMLCDWTISAPRDEFIRLEVYDFEVESKCGGSCSCPDRLQLWDGPEFNETEIGSFCVPIHNVIVSKTNRMRLRFATNREGRFKGFRLSYTTSVTPSCGGDFSGKNGSIISPNYPSSFPAFSDCVWRIKAPVGRYISLRFQEFTGINGINSECLVDSIELKEGHSSEAPLIGRYCIQNIPPVIVSKGHEMYIYFKARSRELKVAVQKLRRFKALFLTHTTECNETIGLEDGRVKNSQLSASSYYTLQLGQGQLHLSPRHGRVRNAYSWCSQAQTPNRIVDEYLQIDLIKLTEITAITTQGYHLGTEYMGFVSSYRLQYTYDGNHWISYMDNTKNSTRPGYTEFKGNSNYKDIKKNILKPSIVAKRIRIFPTGYQSFPFHHMCLKAELYGCPFNDLGCGSIITLAKPNKISVRGSDRQTKECTWLSIPSRPSPQNEVITFHFIYFDVPCKHGHVMLLTRDDNQIQKFCGADPPRVSSLPAARQIMVKLKLEKGAAVWGFDLKYRTEYLGCGEIIRVTESGTVTSPSYPELYDNDQNCTWLFSSEPGSKIALRFIEFDLQPANGSKCLDFVQIQEGRIVTIQPTAKAFFWSMAFICPQGTDLYPPIKNQDK
ncbi:cubilin-like isoform X2 [Stylophora pistillata]|uniref:cubilin-like isoform X2 n=1 Tax=Stylophora pistillata TaxID=50429 RepID=UPI000C052BB5|nr:cubilin-like isoform X2 [Stylophora pistillata]